MQVSLEQLEERYSQLSDDELMSIYISADLSDSVRQLLKAELELRKLTAEDLEDTVKVEQLLARERESARASISKKFTLRNLLLLPIRIVIPWIFKD